MKSANCSARTTSTNARHSSWQSASRVGRASLNWEKGEEILYREYSALLPGLRAPQRENQVELAQAPAIGH